MWSQMFLYKNPLNPLHVISAGTVNPPTDLQYSGNSLAAPAAVQRASFEPATESWLQ